MNCNKTKLQVSKPIYPNNNIYLITAEIIPSIPIYNNHIPPLLEIYTTHYIPHKDQFPYIPHVLSRDPHEEYRK